MWLWMLAGCGVNWIGTWDMARLELIAPDAALTHGDVGWISCDDQLECQMLRRYDVDVQALAVEPLSQISLEYVLMEDEDAVVWWWGEAMQLQMEVTDATQTSILLEGTAVVLEASPYQSLDARVELVR